ncbi:MAG: hypothetical protein ACKVQU_00140 [Burkholderiales bacterium]
MDQLTIRGFDRPLERAIRALAKAEGISLNQAALKLLRSGAGLETGSKQNGTRRDVVGNTLDWLIGSWTEEEEKQFLDAIAPLEQVDADLWR